MTNKFKKTLFSLGTLALTASAVSMVISCGNTVKEDKTPKSEDPKNPGTPSTPVASTSKVLQLVEKNREEMIFTTTDSDFANVDFKFEKSSSKTEVSGSTTTKTMVYDLYLSGNKKLAENEQFKITFYELNQDGSEKSSGQKFEVTGTYVEEKTSKVMDKELTVPAHYSFKVSTTASGNFESLGFKNIEVVKLANK
ncbi:hypothetical protein [Mesomycoplasma lagogenitalium]|uniref:Lipoprotein n=1 Tax=Mesomycoplasma lagogenitalium TaxID=171286 RepID=A0ABY8LUE5_9BACT|nr:hypothetical protein [Mesomycoplasma lagogenitalium]WGI36864.1 hypothetical protein QEG99_01095 [Mesomycoplasma lagogenitalium]